LSNFWNLSIGSGVYESTRRGLAPLSSTLATSFFWRQFTMSRSSYRPAVLSIFLFGLLLAPTAAQGQAVLINVNPAERVILPRPVIIWEHPHHRPAPLPESTYKIKSLEVNVRLSEQVAKVQVSQSFVNTGSRPMEVSLVFPLPYDGAVDQLTLLIDGKEVSARLLGAKEARSRYEEIVRKNRDPALLEWIGTGMFQTSVFPVPPGAERRVTLRYTQLCRKTDGATDFLFPLSTAKYTSTPVEEIKFHVAIDSEQPIKNVYSPTQSVEIKRPDDQHAIVSYTVKNEIPTSDFRLFYDVGKGSVGASVMSYRPSNHGDSDHEDGYFLLLASPEIKAADAARPKKTVVFVLDRSGSMSGEKIEQAKGAVKFVLNNLHQGDLFNIIAFDSEVESWRPELQRFNDETRKKALGFVEGIYAGGSTNIDGALKTALTQMKDSSRPNIVLFMTDGLPTDGEQNEAKIVANSKEYNKVHARIFTFGVGFDLNSRLLDRLSRENFGQSEFVRPNEDIETQVSSLYRRIGAPVLSDLKIAWDIDAGKSEFRNPVNRVYPRAAHDLFAGEQLVVVGRYKKGGAAKVNVSGSVDGKPEKFSFPANLVDHSGDESLAFIEKLWAVRRVGEILDEMDLKGKNDELVKELVMLSTKHGIITPYTSFLADETADSHNVTDNFRAADRRLDALRETDGELGVEQRAAKSTLQNAESPVAATTAPSSSRYAGAAASGGLPGLANENAKLRQHAGQAAAPTFSFTSKGDKSGGRAGPVAGEAAREESEKDAANIAENVRHVGAKVFYRRGKQWIDSAVREEQQKRPIKIERYSHDYFDLIDRFGHDVARYMTFDDPVIVEIAGNAYSF
jgi:Ca-activated chloride channel homolog